MLGQGGFARLPRARHGKDGETFGKSLKGLCGRARNHLLQIESKSSDLQILATAWLVCKH